jgi:hypothetical protein
MMGMLTRFSVSANMDRAEHVPWFVAAEFAYHGPRRVDASRSAVQARAHSAPAVALAPA